MIKKRTVVGLVIIIILLSISYNEHRLIWNPRLLENKIGTQATFLSDEYFYELDELFKQVKINNDKWYVFDGSKKIAAKSVVSKMMKDLESNPIALSYHKNSIQFFEVFDRNVRRLNQVSEEIHFFRNTLNTYGDAPHLLNEMITLAAEEKWKLFSARYHRYNLEGTNSALNVKFISADGRFEAVYNVGTGEIVGDSFNIGTYNYAPGSINPIKYYQHSVFDKIPWKKWGNVRGTSYEEIISLESLHGLDEAKQNEKQVKKWIQESSNKGVLGSEILLEKSMR